MALRFKIAIAGREMFLTAAQLDKLATALKGCEVGDTEWKGRGKGFYGDEQQYEIRFSPFDVKKHLYTITPVDQEELDNLKTLIAMRDNKLAEDN